MPQVDKFVNEVAKITDTLAVLGGNLKLDMVVKLRRMKPKKEDERIIPFYCTYSYSYQGIKAYSVKRSFEYYLQLGHISKGCGYEKAEFTIGLNNLFKFKYCLPKLISEVIDVSWAPGNCKFRYDGENKLYLDAGASMFTIKDIFERNQLTITPMLGTDGNGFRYPAVAFIFNGDRDSMQLISINSFLSFCEVINSANLPLMAQTMIAGLNIPIMSNMNYIEEKNSNGSISARRYDELPPKTTLKDL